MSVNLPVYYTFSEFQQNYDEVFQNWKKVYPEGEEKDFIHQYREKYSSYVRYDEEDDVAYLYDGIEVKKEVTINVRSNKGFEKTFIDNEPASINFPEFAKILQKRIEDYIDRKKRLIENIDDYSNYVDNVEMFDDRYIDSFIFKKETSDPYLIKYYQYHKIKDFFEVKEIVFFEDISYIVSFNEIMYKNFEYSIPKIFNFFNDKIYGKNPRPEHKKEERIIPIPLPETKNNKIPINGNTQLISYIFSELISKGYIAPEKRSGNINTTATARMILDHFEFVDAEEQPTLEYLRKCLFEQNSLSTDKQQEFKIPPFNRVK